MKIGEALARRKDLKVQAQNLANIVTLYSTVPVGETKAPEREPGKAYLAMLDTFEEIRRYDRALLQTNANVTLPNDKDGPIVTLAQALMEREALLAEQKTVLETVRNVRTRLAPETSYEDDKRVTIKKQLVDDAVAPVVMEGLANDLGKRVRELNNLIQALDWTTEVVGL